MAIPLQQAMRGQQASRDEADAVRQALRRRQPPMGGGAPASMPSQPAQPQPARQIPALARMTATGQQISPMSAAFAPAGGRRPVNTSRAGARGPQGPQGPASVAYNTTPQTGPTGPAGAAGAATGFGPQSGQQPLSSNLGPHRGALEGFDFRRYDTFAGQADHPEHGNSKTAFGYYASQVDPYAPNAVQQVADLMNKDGWGVQVVGEYGDRIQFADGTVVDVLRNKAWVHGDQSQGLGWQWLMEGGQTAPGAGMTGAASGNPVAAALIGQPGMMPTGQLAAPAMGADQSGARTILEQALAELAKQRSPEMAERGRGR